MHNIGVCQPGQKSEFWAGRNFLVVDRMSEDDRPIRGAMGSPHELLTKKKGVQNGQFGPNWPPMEEKSKIVKNSNIIALFFPSCKVKEWNCPSKPVVGHSHPLRPQIRPNQARYWSYTGYHTINWKKKGKNSSIWSVFLLVTQSTSGLSNASPYATYLMGFGGIKGV